VLKTALYFPLPESDGVEKLPPPEDDRVMLAPEIICVPFEMLMSRTMFPPGETDEGLGTTATVRVGRGLTMTLVCAEPLAKPDLLATTWRVVLVADVTVGAVKLAV
jgi:hypothetical protein